MHSMKYNTINNSRLLLKLNEQIYIILYKSYIKIKKIIKNIILNLYSIL